jgi:hypothetical protein
VAAVAGIVETAEVRVEVRNQLLWIDDVAGVLEVVHTQILMIRILVVVLKDSGTSLLAIGCAVVFVVGCCSMYCLNELVAGARLVTSPKHTGHHP